MIFTEDNQYMSDKLGQIVAAVIAITMTGYCAEMPLSKDVSDTFSNTIFPLQPSSASAFMVRDKDKKTRPWWDLNARPSRSIYINKIGIS